MDELRESGLHLSILSARERDSERLNHALRDFQPMIDWIAESAARVSGGVNSWKSAGLKMYVGGVPLDSLVYQPGWESDRKNEEK